MPNPDKPDYTHGSNGTKPSDSVDYENGDPLDSENLDYFINTPFEKIKAIIDRLVTIDSDGDGKVDAADTADSATTASKVKGNDIDSDGDGKVDTADTADSATTASKVKGNDIDSDGDGVVNEADSANTYKNNDIDSDGDGRVDAAEQADNADTIDGFEANELISSSTTDDGSDISYYSLDNTPNQTTLVDYSGGGVWMGGRITDSDWDIGDRGDAAAEITVDGGTTYTVPFRAGAGGNGNWSKAELPQISFESSLKIVILPSQSADAAGWLKT